MKTSTSIFLLLISFCMLFFYTKPQYENWKVLRGEYSKYNEALEKAKDLKVLRDELLVKYNNIPEEEVEKLKKVVPRVFNPVKLSADINGIASQYGMTLFSVSIKDIPDASAGLLDENPSPYKTVSIDFETKGSYENFVAMLKDIENHIQLSDVKKLTLEPLKKDELGVGLNFKVSIDSYWLK